MDRNNLDLKAIHPCRGSKYSPNLYKWIMNRYHKHRRAHSMIFVDQKGELWIGSKDSDGWFYGCRLIAVLCNGSKEDSGAYADGFRYRYTTLDGFWDRYIAYGRCAIDPKHEISFIGDKDRWEYSGDGQTRQCQWCEGVTQRLHTWKETVTKSRWENTRQEEFNAKSDAPSAVWRVTI